MELGGVRKVSQLTRGDGEPLRHVGRHNYPKVAQILNPMS